MSLPFAVGDRVVVRYRLPDGRATDALGILLEADAETLVVDGIRGRETISVDAVLLAKAVPPAVASRRGASRRPASAPRED